MTGEQIEVREDAAHHRFEILVGGKPAGKAVYRGGDSVYEFLHTEIDPAFEGQGLGSTLVHQVLDTMHERGAAVVPTCPFVRAYIDKHPAYADLLRPGA